MQHAKEYEVHSDKGSSDTSMRLVVWCPATQHMFSETHMPTLMLMLSKRCIFMYFFRGPKRLNSLARKLLIKKKGEKVHTVVLLMNYQLLAM